MPAKDNDPKAPKASAKSPAKSTAKTPAKSRAKAKPDATASAAVPETPAKPKRTRSVRRPATVAAATEATSSASVPSLESAEPVVRASESNASLEGEVRLRAYLLYAERGFRGGSPESDWFQAEREVVYGRQA
jgi:hypothetical protein